MVSKLCCKKILPAPNATITHLTMKDLFYISKKSETKLITNVYTANSIHIGEPTFTNMSKENIEKRKLLKNSTLFSE